MPAYSVTQLIPQQITRLIVALVLMVALIAISWRAYSFWQEVTGKPQPVSSTTAQQNTDKPQRSLPEIVNLHLFGRPAEVVTKPPEEQQNLPETRLKLVLRGVASAAINSTANLSSNQSESNTVSPSGALIEGPDRVTEFFRIGSLLPGDVKLHAVYANRIVIDRKGKLENLSFPDDWADSGSIVNFSSLPNDNEDYSEAAEIQADAMPDEMPEEMAPNGSDEIDQEQLALQASLFEERVMMGQAESYDDGTTTDESASATDAAEANQREQIKSRLQDLRDIIRQQQTQ